MIHCTWYLSCLWLALHTNGRKGEGSPKSCTANSHSIVLWKKNLRCLWMPLWTFMTWPNLSMWIEELQLNYFNKNILKLRIYSSLLEMITTLLQNSVRNNKKQQKNCQFFCCFGHVDLDSFQQKSDIFFVSLVMETNKFPKTLFLWLIYGSQHRPPLRPNITWIATYAMTRQSMWIAT